MRVFIPARANSRRVPNKNYREFVNGKSLMDIKLEQLKAAGIPAQTIFVSCEDVTKQEAIEKHGCIFLPRDLFLTTPEGEKNLTRDLIETMPGLRVGPDNPGGDILYVSVTDAFFNEFAAMLTTWKRVRDKYDSLLVVRKLTDQVLYGDGSPANFDYFGQPTQCMKGWFTVSMCAIMTKRATIADTGHYIGRRPYLFVTRDVTIDIDTQDDFALAASVYAEQHN